MRKIIFKKNMIHIMSETPDVNLSTKIPVVVMHRFSKKPRTVNKYATKSLTKYFSRSAEEFDFIRNYVYHALRDPILDRSKLDIVMMLLQRSFEGKIKDSSLIMIPKNKTVHLDPSDNIRLRRAVLCIDRDLSVDNPFGSGIWMQGAGATSILPKQWAVYMASTSSHLFNHNEKMMICMVVDV